VDFIVPDNPIRTIFTIHILAAVGAPKRKPKLSKLYGLGRPHTGRNRRVLVSPKRRSSVVLDLCLFRRDPYTLSALRQKRMRITPWRSLYSYDSPRARMGPRHHYNRATSPRLRIQGADTKGSLMSERLVIALHHVITSTTE